MMKQKALTSSSKKWLQWLFSTRGSARRRARPGLCRRPGATVTGTGDGPGSASLSAYSTVIAQVPRAALACQY